MDKSLIIEELIANYDGFAKSIASLPETDFMFSLNGDKWTAGQQTDHLIRSLAPLNKALKLPAPVLKTMFGKADHPSASYEDVVAEYRSKLAAGGSATPPFMPEPIEFARRDELLDELWSQLEKLCKHIERFDDTKLDTLVLPHPLLGKLTLREMFCFTIYHGEHHHAQMQKNLAARS